MNSNSGMAESRGFCFGAIKGVTAMQLMRLAGKMAAVLLCFALAQNFELAAQQAPGGSAAVSPVELSSEEAMIQGQINSIYRNFHDGYRLGPGDVLSIHVERHAEDSVERVAVSPMGKVYYPLLGNVQVAGKTIPQLQEHFTTAISEFIKDPRVIVSLVEAHSAKIGILGDVRAPGVLVMSGPMRILDAITAVGGITETGNSSKVSLLRQYEDGRVQVLEVNIKKMLAGKGGLEDNVHLRPGDTIIIHGNMWKKIGKVSNLIGIGSFITFLASGKR